MTLTATKHYCDAAVLNKQDELTVLNICQFLFPHLHHTAQLADPATAPWTLCMLFN